MDARDFISRQQAFDGFVSYRKNVFNSADRGEFFEAFSELCAKALDGDCIAQDCVSYFFNKGFDDNLAPNYDYFMSWSILAGANGNTFAIEKMQFFLDPAVNQIVYDDDILTRAFQKGNITKENALNVISNLICEGIVDALSINPHNLTQLNPNPITYKPELYRKYTQARDNCLERVIDFLIS